MSILLYYEDAYAQEFEATVTGVEGRWVCLDRTGFYPGGGGQPSDEGELRFAGGAARIVAARKNAADVWLELEGELPGIGQTVVGALDWDRRYKLMRTHTAMHILCGVIWRDYRASVTGGQMTPLQGRMDFEFPTMRQELVQAVEASINVEVQANRAVGSRILPRAQAFQIPDLIRTKINLLPEGIQEVRVVEIEGLDLQADGGTHVRSTGEVGPLRIVDYKSKGAANKRIVLGLEE
ncbi:MAG TPA: alanyl-tRNA editing protein [Anaerolineales bacterium]|nr:alanyl-tRNA editing protein [Anaerolineales bacterium]